MRKEAVLIYPHQLFEAHPCLQKERIVYLVEDPLFFVGYKEEYKFHKKKLILHRASMKYYYDFLVSKGYGVRYLPYEEFRKTKDSFKEIHKDGIEVLYYTDVADYVLEKRIRKYAQEFSLDLHREESPAFLTSIDWIESHFDPNKSKNYFTSFYIEQRKRLKILVKNGKPTGGKWSFDPENRKKLPKSGLEIPDMPQYTDNPYVKEAETYVNTLFQSNPGALEGFTYAITHKDVKQFFQDFLEKRFSLFGDYEDAIDKDDSIIFHSGISYALNCGLITPREVVDMTISYADETEIPINSLEGFIRQVIGWREYIRAMYHVIGTKERTKNFCGFTKKLPDSFYTAQTGVDPIDNTIRGLLKTGYTHHIERLMILGNFMLLCEIDPDDVYKWFMEMYIDAYDWVMVPNVYGMSQYADGGMIMTKPYTSSSNYVKKMSNYSEGDWCDIWDSLYWVFTLNHREVLEKVPRAKLITRQLDMKGTEKIDHYKAVAKKFLETVDMKFTS